MTGRSIKVITVLCKLDNSITVLHVAYHAPPYGPH